MLVKHFQCIQCLVRGVIYANYWSSKLQDTKSVYLLHGAGCVLVVTCWESFMYQHNFYQHRPNWIWHTGITGSCCFGRTGWCTREWFHFRYCGSCQTENILSVMHKYWSNWDQWNHSSAGFIQGNRYLLTVLVCILITWEWIGAHFQSFVKVLISFVSRPMSGAL